MDESERDEPIAAEDLSGPNSKYRMTFKIMKDPHTSYTKLFEEHGNPARVHAINGDFVMVGSPEGAKEVFATRPKSFCPFGAEAGKPLVGENSVFMLRAEEHKAERKLLRPPFHGERMRSYGETITNATRRVFSEMKPGQEFVAQEAATEISLEVIARAVFGTTGEDEVREMMEAVDDVITFNPLFLFAPVLQVAPLGMGPWAKFQAQRARLVELLRANVERKTAEPGDDILSMLLEARYEDGEALSFEALCDELITLLVAGHETTAIALAWAFHHLYRHPDALETLRAELDAGPDELPARSKMPYLQAVCDETLRITPVVPDVARQIVEPIEVLGVEVPEGWCVGVPITAIHHDPEIYGDPENFRPERFLERKFSPFEFMPFGGGHRRCIGAPFAIFEMTLVLDVALSEFEFELRESEHVETVRRNVTMGPKTGVRMRMVGPRERG